ncbi:hypothetical protein GUY44_07575 [Pimelobacter simplex]|uniref:Uncharacterized protein n=1 Tax=Nocardioides simplex TaxID=2045 RepID=A0A0A1DF40_NOCSI|nr:hypothetical protein [Pimelobacter simplex]AIY15814.2 hypothetical protein KR76_01800 [Pimelobacter simplex]MCG8150334.1 hypothetical protein [Pimelobacter simplex]SFM89819.1 hypothetical protein SAMN05421671_4084 [Pimelobacter simplex]
MSLHAVVQFTHGTENGFVDFFPNEAEARAFVEDPPEVWAPRPQDSLRIFELVEVED